MDADELPQLPLLPAVRPRRLTLTPSSTEEEVDTARSHYGLFGRLPLELRQQILTEAFGNRMLHAGFKGELAPDHPPSSWPERQQARGWKYLVDRTMSWVAGKGWKQPHVNLDACCSRYPDCYARLHWISRVCHRVRFLDTAQWLWRFTEIWGVFSAMRTPDMDSCLFHGEDRADIVYHFCATWPRERRAIECRIGVTGWLLACRHAYSDTIEMLFAENGFHFGHPTLIPNLPRLILPERLANIQKLELIWDILPGKLYRTSDARDTESPAPLEPAKFHNEKLQWVCDSLPEMFPGLKELHLSLMGFIGAPSRRNVVRHHSVLAAERVILAPVEAMLVQMPRLYERVQSVQQEDSKEHSALSISFDCNSFWQAMLWTHDHLGTPGLRAVTDEFTVAGKFWKQLGENGGYWVCSKGLIDGSSDMTMSEFETWGFTADDIRHIDKHIWRGLACPHELWYDDDDPRKLTGA